MPAIRIKPLSATEAERVLGRVWCVLEQHEIASPKVTVRSHPDGRVEMLLTFTSQDLADLMRNELLAWFRSGLIPVGASNPSADMAKVDPALRDRIVQDAEALTDALDQAVANPAPATLDRLREAADQLMRATARVLLETGQSDSP